MMRTDYSLNIAPNAGLVPNPLDFRAKIQYEMKKWTVSKPGKKERYNGCLAHELVYTQEGDDLVLHRKDDERFSHGLLSNAIPIHLAWYRLLCVLDGQYLLDMKEMCLDYEKITIEVCLRHRETGEIFSLRDWKGGLTFGTLETEGEFASDVIELLDLLLMHDLPHPCGVIAGAVAGSERDKYLIAPTSYEKTYDLSGECYEKMEATSVALRKQWSPVVKLASSIPTDPSFNASLAYDVVKKTVVRVSPADVISGSKMCPLSDVMSSALALYRALSITEDLRLTVGPSASKTAVFALPLLNTKTGLHLVVTEHNGAVQFHTEVAASVCHAAEHEADALMLINHLFSPALVGPYGNVMGLVA